MAHQSGDRRVEVFTDPTGPGPFAAYRSRHDYAETDTVPLQFPGGTTIELPVKDMLSAKKR